MAYDAARGQVVLFGGERVEHSSILDDTWVWDGTSWALKAPQLRPTARSGHAIAYDAARGQVVLFGGVGWGNGLDTWTWDGTNWNPKNTAGPAVRYGYAMAYDDAHEQVVLFGGVGADDIFRNETWVWDGGIWTQKSPANRPPLSYGHAMVYDPTARNVVLFGGVTNWYVSSYRNETWVWDGTDWTHKIPIDSPSPCMGHAMTFDAARGQVVMFGGISSDKVNEYYSSQTWIWVPLTKITGKVTVSGVGVSGVMLSLDGSRKGSATTDSEGNFSFQSLPIGGWYRIEPLSASYSYTPSNVYFGDLTANQVANFAATPSTLRYTISGTVTTWGPISSGPLPGVTIVLTGSQNGTQTTDSNGRFAFPNLPAGGDYTLTRSKANYHFETPSVTLKNLAEDIRYSFEGYVNRFTISGNAGVGGAIVTLSGDRTDMLTASPTGAYSFPPIDAGGTYVVTPSKPGYVFYPASLTFSNLIANQTANFAPLSAITITTVPAGLGITVDGVPATAPQTYTWIPGSTHTIAATSSQLTGTRFTFTGWSDGQGISHTVTAPAAPATYTASFSTQYLLTTTTSPSGGGSIVANPTSADGYYAAGTPVQLTAEPNSGFVFGSFSGDLTGAANSKTVTMSAPRFVTANFVSTAGILVTSVPAGLQISVDGVTATAPQAYVWTPGSSHTIAVSSTQGSGTRYTFSNWSDAGAISHTVTAPAGPAAYTANFNTQYLLIAVANPGGGGLIVANPASGDGYYNSGTSVQLTATPASGRTFAFFSGDLAGPANPQNVVMTAPRSVSANFSGGTGGNVPPYGLEFSPYQGAGVTQTFSGTFNDANGWTDIAKASFRFHESYAGTVGACIVEMRPQTNEIALLNDAGVSYLPPVALGSVTPLQNSACSVDAVNSNFGGTGNVLTANVALTFKPAFGTAGGREPRKAICQWAKDTAGAGEDQSCFGMWIPEAPAPTKIPRLRLYNPVNFAHFFTASQNENDVLVGRGFSPEPSPGMVYDQPASVDGIPTRAYYRILFFPTNGAPIFHYWTRDREEYKAAVRLRGLNLGEGIDSFMLTGQVPNTFPLSRLLFTAGPSPYPIYHYALEYETSVLLGMGWGRSMGVEGYLYPPQAPAAVKAPTARAEKRISAVLNAASHVAGPVAPGQLVRVYGRDFSKLAQAFIDGSAVPLLAVTNLYIELAVPETVAGKESIELVIDDLGVRTEQVTLSVALAKPAIFVKDFLGRGLIETLPSEAGTVTLQVTGVGELDLGQPKLPLSVRLNGYPADILSIATITDQSGRLAVNVRIPVEVLAGDADVATVSLQAGEAYAQPGLLVKLR
jgi:uncharacterized protein (TIGR03437 family)